MGPLDGGAFCCCCDLWVSDSRVLSPWLWPCAVISLEILGFCLGLGLHSWSQLFWFFLSVACRQLPWDHSCPGQAKKPTVLITFFWFCCPGEKVIQCLYVWLSAHVHVFPSSVYRLQEETSCSSEHSPHSDLVPNIHSLGN